MDSEYCESCIYNNDNICMRKRKCIDQFSISCEHYVNRYKSHSMDKLIDFMAQMILESGE